MNYTLFQWPKLQWCDSLHPSCTRVQRILNYKRIPYQIREVGLSGFDKTGGDKKFTQMFGSFPILEKDGEIFKEILQILPILRQRHPQPNIEHTNPAYASQDRILCGWAEGRLSDHLIYNLWRQDENFNALISAFELQGGYGDAVTQLPAVRKFLLEGFSNRLIGRSSESDFHQILKDDLDALDSICAAKRFLVHPEHISHADFAVFASIQILFSPITKEGAFLKSSYPQIVRWMDRVNAVTGPAPANNL